MIGAKITNRLVVAHMCKGEITHRDASLLAPMLLIFNQYFNSFIPETLLLYFSLVWVGLDLVWYCSKVCLEICSYLNVSLFTIPYNGASEANSAANTNGNSSHSGNYHRVELNHNHFLSYLQLDQSPGEGKKIAGIFSDADDDVLGDCIEVFCVYLLIIKYLQYSWVTVLVIILPEEPRNVNSPELVLLQSLI